MGMLKIPMKFTEDEKRTLKEYLEDNNVGCKGCIRKDLMEGWMSYTCKTDESGLHTVSFLYKGVSVDSEVVLDIKIRRFSSGCEKDGLADKITSYYRNIVEEKMEGVGV